jgi:hypothetical protein
MSEKSPQCPDISGHSRTSPGQNTSPDQRNSPDLRVLPDVDLTYDLDHRQLRAIQLTTLGWRFSRIASEIHVDPRTLYRWRTENDNFRSALAQAKTDRDDSADQHTHGVADLAVDVLEEILHEAQDTHRLRAAQIILTHSTRLKPKPTSRSENQDEESWPEPELPPKVG